MFAASGRGITRFGFPASTSEAVTNKPGAKWTVALTSFHRSSRSYHKYANVKFRLVETATG